ncbi:T9SS type A sorting domain-containing protein [Winogradskyella wichelsiae]|uniref:T9SS type A sorting domain-containing protein n=1 Tax=Winogradskyella wichelsiae TaxID=2697007 RepID=UPI0015C858EA|nr:T9SS type A sorting domain-containing protein [Winogradskyella wichelsiae]
MKKQLLFIMSFMFATTLAFAQAIITVDAVDQDFNMVSPLVTSVSTGTAATIGGNPSAYTQIRADEAGSDDVAGTFDLIAQTSSGTTDGTISFDFRKREFNTMAIKITVGTETPQTFTYSATDGGTGTYQQLTATYVGAVTFSTTPTPIRFEITDLDLGTAPSITAARLYKFNVTDKNVPEPPLDAEAVLEAGNEWYHNYSPDTFNASLNEVQGGEFLEQASAVATPTTTGNSSPFVAKFTKGDDVHSQLKFQLPAVITSANQSAAIFKIRAYAPSTNVDGSSGRRLRLFLRDGVETVGQKNVTIDVTVYDQWQEYTFDFTGITLTEGVSYSTVNLLFDQPDADFLATGNIYYLDAFQGPAGATLSTNDFELNSASINVYPNPVTNSFQIDSNNSIDSVELYNITGQLLKTFSEVTNYDISDLATGIYIANIKTQFGSKTIRVVKN